MTPISTATQRAGKIIKVGGGPAGVAITPDGRTAYVVNYDSGTVTPISTATQRAGRAITIAPDPAGFGIAITPDGTTAYITNDQQTGTVTPVNLATRAVGTPIKAGSMAPRYRDYPGWQDGLHHD